MLFPLFCIPLVLVRNRILNENKNFFSKIHRIHRLRTHTYHVLTPPPPAALPADSGVLQPQQGSNDQYPDKQGQVLKNDSKENAKCDAATAE